MCLALLHAADPPPFLVPDRPDVSNGIVIIPTGSAQVELGLEGTGYPKRRPRDALGFTTSARIGISERVEIRLSEGEPLRWLAEGSTEPSMGFGIKTRLFQTASGSGIGLQPMIVSRPYQLGAKHSLPGVALTFIGSHVFGARVAIDVNVGARFDPLRVRAVDFTGSASLGLHLHPRALLFLEAFAFAEDRPDLRIAHGADAGVIVAIAPKVSLDAAVRGADLASAPEVVVVAGLTFGWAGRAYRVRSPARTGVRP